MTELDVCSPFVVGQCRSEHEAHIAIYKANAEEASNRSKGREVREEKAKKDRTGSKSWSTECEDYLYFAVD